MLGMVPAAEEATLIAGIEIFTRTSALTAVQGSPEYKEYVAKAEREAPYSRDLTAWYPTAGFVARGDQTETGPAQIVMLAKFVSKDGEGVREKLVDVLG